MPLALGLARSAVGGAGSGGGDREVPTPRVTSPTTGSGGEASGPVPSVLGQDAQGAQIPVLTAGPSGANDDGANATGPNEAAAAAAAQRFASLWLAGAFIRDRHRWASTMSDLVDPSLVPFLESTPASAIPRTSVTSTVPRLVAPSYGSARVSFGNGAGMDLELSATGRTWRVVQYLPSTRP